MLMNYYFCELLQEIEAGKIYQVIIHKKYINYYEEFKKEYYNEPVRPEMGEPYLSKNYYKNRYQTFFRIIFYLL